jgi:hypothetical protein
MQYRFRELNKILKQTVTIIPNNGQSDVRDNDTIILELPHNSVVDLNTFIMEYNGETNHLGKTNGGGGIAAAGYLQTRFSPRNSASIIEQLDVEINGQTRFTCNNYGLLYNTLFDYTAAQDSLNRRKVGENADPSSKFGYVHDAAGDETFIERRGYSVGLISDGSARDKEDYVIRSWLGLLNPSTAIIDTNILGSVVIKIRLAPSTCLMLGAVADAATDAITAVTTETGILLPAVIAGTALTAEASGYTLKSVKFSIVRYDMPQEFYMGQAAKLGSGVVFKLWFPNYSIQSCASVPVGNKKGVNRTSISTRSLDWVLGTFRLPNYTTQVVPINSFPPAAAASGEIGLTRATWESQVRAGCKRLFNNSRYFARNGTSVTDCTWIVGNSRYPSRTVQQQFDGLLQHFNFQNDQGSGGMYPGIQSINHFKETFYGDILSLNCNQSESDFVVSGLDTQETPLQITWEVNAKAVNATALNAPIFTVAADLCTPYLICGYTSCLKKMSRACAEPASSFLPEASRKLELPGGFRELPGGFREVRSSRKLPVAHGSSWELPGSFREGPGSSREPSVKLPATSGKLPGRFREASGSSWKLPGSSRQLPAAPGRFRRASRNLRGRFPEASWGKLPASGKLPRGPGSSRELPGSFREGPGSSRKIPGSSSGGPGKVREAPRSFPEVPGSFREASGRSGLPGGPGRSRKLPGIFRQLPGSFRKLPGSFREASRKR